MKQRALLRIAIQHAHTFRRPTHVKLLLERRVAAEHVGLESCADGSLRAVFHDEERVAGGGVAVAARVHEDGATSVSCSFHVTMEVLY